MTGSSLAAQLLTISLLALQRQLAHNQGLHLNDPSVWWRARYDFIIVGGGTAGCVLASRLSEVSNISVLLIEAGGPQTVLSEIVPSHFGDDVSVVYRSMPQPNAGRANPNSGILYPRGRVLGGSHTINIAVHSRGNPRIYDNWSTQYGASGWSYSEVLSNFLRLENNTDESIRKMSPGYHSTDGPIQISTIPELDPIYERWINATRAMGWPNVDFNGPTQFGSAVMQTTQKATDYIRHSTATAYLEPHIGRRPNLDVLVNSFVTRILFANPSNSSGNPQAIGVEFVHDNQTYQVQAAREVILSAGSFGSPQLLMLSGVGPKLHLEALNIPVLVDSPVGATLYDHSIVFMDALLTNASDVGFGSNPFTSFTLSNLLDFYVHNRGPLTREAIVETYIPTGVNGDRDFPDIVMYFELIMNNPDLNEAIAGYNPDNLEEWREYMRPLVEAGIQHASIAFNNYRPRSRGSLRLNSADPFDAPLIDPNFFSHPLDLLATVRGMRIGLKVLESPQMQLHLRYTSVPVPGCIPCTSKPLSECLSYLRCVAQSMTGSSGHPVATCRMGNSTNTEAVVDERLRVQGVERLRVVDASIMPMVPNANINAAVIMIAERAVDLIKSDNRL